MSDYLDIYLKRLNRYGNDYQSRVEGARMKNFEDYLLKSNYRVNFLFNDKLEAGCLERYKQDETQTLQYFLTRLNVKIPNGTVLMLADDWGKERPWMVYWLEDIKTSGYNRYVVLKMTHLLRWTARDGKDYETWAYFYGQEDNMLKDELKSRSRSSALYTENLKLSFFVTGINPKIKKDIYFEIGDGELLEAYRVTGYDIQSSEGVEYVSVDPIYEYDHSEPPRGDGEEYYWLNGGDTDGSS